MNGPKYKEQQTSEEEQVLSPFSIELVISIKEYKVQTPRSETYKRADSSGDISKYENM